MIEKYLIPVILGIVLGIIGSIIYLKIKNKKSKENIPVKLISKDLKIQEKDKKEVDNFFNVEEHEKIKKKIEFLKDKKLLKKMKVRKKKVKKKKVKKK